MSDPQDSVFKGWLARTGGLEPPNRKERFGMILANAEAGNSFTASDMLWVIGYLSQGYKTRESLEGHERL